ncbi:MAG: hypothetical protein ACREM3_17565 [Candidatus Rokuibacteriota bacterium]
MICRRLGLTMAAAMLLAACGRTSGPEDVVLAYGRALYASDSDEMWGLVSAADRRVKDEATFRRQQQDVQGFTREVLGQLAGYITATPVKAAVTGAQARVTLRFRLPDANAPAIRDLVHGWDENELGRLPSNERARIRERLEQLRRDGALPVVEGDETFDLVREGLRWRVFLNWAGGVRVAFLGAPDPALPLRVSVEPAAAVLARGERMRVTVSVTNAGRHEITTRVRHRTKPDTEADHLALLQCPLLVPVRLAPGETAEFVSEYLLLADAPEAAKALEVTYAFPAGEAQAR